MTEEDLNMSNEQLLDSLGLFEQGRLKRAAILLFHRNPEKWVTGAYIKMDILEKVLTCVIRTRFMAHYLYRQTGL